MDKYDTSYNDPYCYDGTFVLKNKLNIRDFREFEDAERDITAYTIKLVEYKKPPYTLVYLQTLHKKLFSELYEWAGKLRTVNIFKGDTTFCYYDNLVQYSNDLFRKLDEEQYLKGLDKNSFCEKLAEYYCEFNMVHPFREGNGRVQRLFFEHLALYNGYVLNWDSISKEDWIQANIAGITDYEPMENIFKRVL